MVIKWKIDFYKHSVILKNVMIEYCRLLENYCCSIVCDLMLCNISQVFSNCFFLIWLCVLIVLGLQVENIIFFFLHSQAKPVTSNFDMTSQIHYDWSHFLKLLTSLSAINDIKMTHLRLWNWCYKEYIGVFDEMSFDYNFEVLSKCCSESLLQLRKNLVFTENPVLIGKIKD